MNILGHGYIALSADNAEKMQRIRMGTDNADDYERDLIVGALLPESCPFISNNPFSFDEIHEGGEILLNFLKEKYPDRTGIALGMLAHSVKFGADSFNQEIEQYADGKREELLTKICLAFNINKNDAPKRLHNVLWMGVDFWILEKYPNLVVEISNAIKQVDSEKLAMILAECFKRDIKGTKHMLDILFRRIYIPKDLSTKKGLVNSWIRQVEGLPEKDKVNFEKAYKLALECQELMKNDWEGLLIEVEESVRERSRRFITIS